MASHHADIRDLEFSKLSHSSTNNKKVASVEDIKSLLLQSYDTSLGVNVYGKLFTLETYNRLNSLHNTLNIVLWQSIMKDLPILQESWMLSLPHVPKGEDPATGKRDRNEEEDEDDIEMDMDDMLGETEEERNRKKKKSEVSTSNETHVSAVATAERFTSGLNIGKVLHKQLQ